ncbi:response regulator [candidate division KSB1 bacterium]|nr:response regulator [candidate division KSB1 bacterium]
MVRILYIEDDPEDFQIVQSYLRRSGSDFWIYQANTGQAAIQFLDTNSVDCVLLDQNLPDTNGLVLLQEIKIRIPELPVIMLTGQRDERLTLGSSKLGAVNFLVKYEIDSKSLSECILKSLTAQPEESHAKNDKRNVTSFFENFSGVYQTIVETMTEGLVALDMHKTILYCNKRIDEMLNIAPQSLIGQHISVLFSREQYNHFVKQCGSIKSNRTFKYEAEMIRRGDSSLPVLISHTPQFDRSDTQIGYLFIVTDFSDLKKARDALRRQKMKFESVVKSSSEGILLVDSHGNIRVINPAGRRMLSSLSDSTSRRQISEIARLSIRTMYEHVFTQSANSIKKEVSAIDKSGRTFVVTFSPVTGQDMNADMLININETTEMQQAQEQLAHSAKMASLGMMAAGVAHEINNPLTSVIGYSELSLMSHLPDDIRENLNTILEEGERARRIVENMLEFSYDHATDHDFVLINQVIRITTKLLGKQLILGNINIETELDSIEPVVCGDKGQIQQVFINLIQNAYDAMTASAIEGVITISTVVLADNQVRIRVQDTGSGISNDVRQKIFDPFFTTKAPGEGTGLGLSICYKIITKLQGTMLVNSKPGVGTTFTIMLPTVIDNSNEQNFQNNVANVAKESAGLSGRIAIVDENSSHAHIGELFTQSNFKVTIYSDETEAMDVFTRNECDVLLIDIKRLNEIKRRMNNSSSRWKSGIIFLSRFPINAHVQNLLSEQGFHCLAQPVRGDELVTHVRDIVIKKPGVG